MSFAGKVWRLLVAIKDALGLIFLLLFFTALFMILSIRPNAGEVRKGALLLKLDGSVVEEMAPVSMWDLLYPSAVPTKEFPARDLVRAIDSAAGDTRIKALALDMATFTGGGQVHMEEIAAALDRFRAAKKPVLAYAVAYSDDSLLLAAHASEVWVDPLGGAAITGPGGTRLYYKGLLDRLKLNVHVFRVGTYKSAVEPYLLSGMSDPARENATAYLATLWQEWQANVKLARPQANIALATEQVPAWLAASNGDLARAAVAAGLVDKIGTRVDWGTRVAQLAGRESWDDAPGAFAKTDLDAWVAETAPKTGGFRGFEGGGGKIGVITIAGEISDGEAGPGEAGAARIARLLDDSLDKGFKALVVRVDSPGGSVTGSEAIRRAILRYKARRIPVVVSMGNVAASGGYWVATPADRIFAEPETITGSIGIFGVVPTFEAALAQWGVTTDGVRTTPLSGQPDLFAGFTPEAEAVLQATVDSGYQRFLSLVASSRRMTPQRVNELAQGRVWDGGSARQLGLVDQFGDLDDALAWAAKQAKLSDGKWRAEYLGADEDRYAPLLRRIWPRKDDRAAGDMFALFAGHERQRAAQVMSDLQGLLKVQGMQARCLECPSAVRPLTASLSDIGALQMVVRTLFD
ncbi:MAG: signal peptide peptidase SppA [Croceibacterium sp.]